jgi:hypothetical protein
LIREYHEAFLVVLLGPDASTVPPERIEELLRSGALDPEDIGRVHLTVGDERLNPYEYMRLVSRAYAGLGEDDAVSARFWGFDDWAPHVLAELARARAEERRPHAIEPRTAPGPRPEPPEFEGAVEPPQTPDWMSPRERASHREALARAGAYARGLGNVYADDMSVKMETWEGETIDAEVDPGQRAEALATIRELTGEALVTHRDAEKLGRDLAHATGHFSHNWRRIAATELQGAHNLGMVEHAVDRYGEDGRVVRITESGACEHCVRLLRDSEGLPKVFSVRELLENGTNIGRQAGAWLPTAWPIHPNCRCDTRVVPPGRTVTVDGRIRREEAA